MAVDVIQKAKNANSYRHGAVLVSADKFGNIETYGENIQVNQPADSTLQNRLDTRFDDITYYST